MHSETRRGHLSLVPPELDRGIDPGIVTVDSTLGLEITATRHGERCTIQVAGELDFDNADRLTAVVEKQLRLGCSRFTLDLAQLSFCDCAGLRVIVAAHNRSLERSGSLTISAVHRSVAKVLAITQLDQALTVRNIDGRADVRTPARERVCESS